VEIVFGKIDMGEERERNIEKTKKRRKFIARK